MDYPIEFVKKAKKLYPTWKSLHKMIKKGDSIVGAYLADDCEKNISPEVVLEKINNGKIEELQQMAELILEKRALYQEHCDLFMDYAAEKHAARAEKYL